MERVENMQITDKPSLFNFGVREKIIISTAVFGILFIAVLIAGSLINADSLRVNLANIFVPPCLKHPFGTDWVGRDMMLRTVKGFSLSMKIDMLCSLSSGFIALIMGVAGSMLGGKVDYVISWLIYYQYRIH